MIVVSNDFKAAMKEPVKEIQAVLDAGGFVISDADDLISFKVSCESGLCKSAMRKLEAKYLGEHNLVGKWVTAGFGVKLASGAYDFLNYGSFLVSEQTVTKDTGVTDIVAYDKMINAMEPYVKLETEYPISLYDYTAKLCGACGIELGNCVFGNQLVDFNNASNTSLYTSYTFENDVLTVSATDGIRQYIEYDVLKLFKDNGGKTLYFDYESVDFSKGKSPTVQAIIARGSALSYAKFVGTNGIKQSFAIPENVDDITAATLIIECNNTDDAGECSISITKPMLQFGTNKLSYQKYNQMNDWQIERELWENISGITYRDIFVQIAQATASTCIIRDDKVYFKPITATQERLTYNNLMKLKLEPLYGEINSVVLSRAPQEDNVYLRDEESVAAHGLTEFRIENNEIVDKDRESALPAIADGLIGVAYYPFEATTEGLGWYEIGDHFDIENDAGELFGTTLFNYSITIDGAIKETLKTAVESKAQTQYQTAKNISKRVKNAEIVVNKQEQYIQSIVSDVEDANKKYTEIYQDIDRIEQRVQNSGGSNLLKNSVMFAVDKDGKPNDWGVINEGITIQDDVDALHSGGVSGHSFTLTNNQVSQRVPVKISTDESPSSYAFSIRIKKGTTGSATVTLLNDFEEKEIYLPVGKSADFDEYEISGLHPKQNYYSVLISADDGTATFTDCMFASGGHKSKWTQANGEVMNTQVTVSIDGVVVKRVDEDGNYDGDYTAMTPQEFAGYSNVGGTPTRVFSLNKDVTKVKKLEAEDEMKMPPIKIVPITEGDIQGWAFVPCT